MAYKIGQLIKDLETDYLSEAITINTDELNKYTNKINLAGTTFQFIDCAIRPTSVELKSTSTYFLSFYVDKMIIDNKYIDFSFDINLKQEVLNGSEEHFYQYIRTIEIEAGEEKDKVLVNIIFTPNDTYDYITLTVLRDSTDWLPGKMKKMTISDVKLREINNILPTSNIVKIGIQAPSGLMFTINGEEMMMGRTGIYELYNKEIPITKLGFVTEKENNDNFFIIDYQYEE